MENTESNPFEEETITGAVVTETPVEESTLTETPVDAPEIIEEDEKPFKVGELSDELVSEHVKLMPHMIFPTEGMTLTIEDATITKPFPSDALITSQDGKRKFYKKKLVLKFAEKVNDLKLLEYYPSVFYGEDLNPSIPKACPDDKLEDSMTSKVAKIRNKFLKTYASEYAPNQSNAGFLKALVGKKVFVKKSTNVWQGRTITSLDIQRFVPTE